MALDPHPAGPGTPSRPVSVYGLTKRDQEELLLELLPPRGVDVIALRLQNVYGPGQSLRNPYTGILSIFSVRLLAGSGINVFEDGRESRDFVHVDDVVEAFLRAGEADLSPDAHVLDVGTGRPATVLEVARLLADSCQVDRECIAVTGDYRVGDVRHAFCDPGPLRGALGITASIPLAEGVRGLVDWVRRSERAASRLDDALDEMRTAGLLGRAESS
jgi:dTDP-L-rhamnose 4-epimerase